MELRIGIKSPEMFLEERMFNVEIDGYPDWIKGIPAENGVWKTMRNFSFWYLFSEEVSGVILIQKLYISTFRTLG